MGREEEKNSSESVEPNREGQDEKNGKESERKKRKKCRTDKMWINIGDNVYLVVGILVRALNKICVHIKKKEIER